VLTFGWGRCSLEATPEILEVRVEATDEDGLRRIQEGIRGRLETIGSQDRLQVTWEAPLALTTVRDQDGGTSEPAAGPAGRGRSLRNWLLGGAGALLVVGHHGLGIVLGIVGLGAIGAALAGGRLTGWTGTAADILLALIVLKVVFGAVNALVLGRLFGRRQAVQQAMDRRLPPAAARVLRWVLG
jgi:hypothetical protein